MKAFNQNNQRILILSQLFHVLECQKLNPSVPHHLLSGMSRSVALFYRSWHSFENSSFIHSCGFGNNGITLSCKFYSWTTVEIITAVRIWYSQNYYNLWMQNGRNKVIFFQKNCMFKYYFHIMQNVRMTFHLLDCIVLHGHK